MGEVDARLYGDYGYMYRSDVERFWRVGNVYVVQVGHFRCWQWNATKDHRGYGRFWLNGRYRPAHRIMWQYISERRMLLRIVARVFSEVKPELDHRCNNRACIRPSHLQPTNHKGNHQLRAERYWARKLARAERIVRGLHPLLSDELI